MIAEQSPSGELARRRWNRGADVDREIERIRSRSLFESEVETRLRGWLAHVSLHGDQAQRTIERIEEEFLSARPIREVEERLHDHLFGLVGERIEDRLRDEEELVFREIRDHLLPGSCLDVGAGSGLIAHKIADAGHRVQLVDVIDFNRSPLPLDVYDGRSLPYAEASFDNVTLLTVLHHCDDPMAVLREAIRVARRRLVIIESLHVDDAELRSNMFFDWLWNRVLYRGINVPFNFLPPWTWREIFVAEGLVIRESIDLGYDSPMTPEHHWLFVLDRPELESRPGISAVEGDSTP